MHRYTSLHISSVAVEWTAQRYIDSKGGAMFYFGRWKKKNKNGTNIQDRESLRFNSQRQQQQQRRRQHNGFNQVVYSPVERFCSQKDYIQNTWFRVEWGGNDWPGCDVTVDPSLHPQILTFKISHVHKFVVFFFLNYHLAKIWLREKNSSTTQRTGGELEQVYTSTPFPFFFQTFF